MYQYNHLNGTTSNRSQAKVKCEKCKEEVPKNDCYVLDTPGAIVLYNCKVCKKDILPVVKLGLNEMIVRNIETGETTLESVASSVITDVFLYDLKKRGERMHCSQVTINNIIYNVNSFGYRVGVNTYFSPKFKFIGPDGYFEGYSYYTQGQTYFKLMDNDKIISMDGHVPVDSDGELSWDLYIEEPQWRTVEEYHRDCTRLEDVNGKTIRVYCGRTYEDLKLFLLKPLWRYDTRGIPEPTKQETDPNKPVYQTSPSDSSST